MRTVALQSGSSGNCFFVEAAGTRLLVDAGISGIQAERRLAAIGVDIRSIHGLFISHDHVDHIRAAGVFQRKYGLPLFVTRPTLVAASRWLDLGRLDDVRHFSAGETVRLGPLSVETIPTPHDGADGVGFVIDDGRHRLGILTDLGHVFDRLGPIIATVDAAHLESNHDLDLLANGPYPPRLKRRIRGPGGHLANAEAAELLRRHASPRLAWISLCHLSGENNRPALALATHRALGPAGLALHLSPRNAAGPLLELP